MQRFTLTLKLRPDPALIDQYVHLHQNVWPEIQQSIRDAGVLDMQIYRAGSVLFMIMDVTDDFTFERKARMDAANPKVMEWENYMARFQDVRDHADPARKWEPLTKIFQL